MSTKKQFTQIFNKHGEYRGLVEEYAPQIVERQEDQLNSVWLSVEDLEYAIEEDQDSDKFKRIWELGRA